MSDRQWDWTRLSLKEQIGQMIVVRASGYLFDRQIRYPLWEPPAAKLRYWLQELNLGGVILLGASAPELFLRTKQLQSWSKIPLLIAADVEEGVGQRFAGATWFPPLMAIGAIANRDLPQGEEYAAQMGAITAVEALSIGINWLLAPVVDVNNNPQNPVINVRSFSDRPEVVSKLAAAFIKGAKHYPVLTTAKHFPGHGDTASDSHLDLPTLPHSSSRLAEVELLPFNSAIAAGVDSVMSAHLLIPAWDSQRPATLSPSILTGQLREKLGFTGLIVTDALIMGGVAKYAAPEEVAIMAIEAGADILLMPPDPERAIAAVYQAVNSGRLSAESIEASVQRIWQAKQKLMTGEVEEATRVGEVGENTGKIQIDQRTRGHTDAGKIQIDPLCVAASPTLSVRADCNPPIPPHPTPVLADGNPPQPHPISLLPPEFQFLSQLAQPSAIATADKILREAMQISGSLPIQPRSNSALGYRNLILVDDILNCDFLDRYSPAVVIPQQLGYEFQLLEQNNLDFGQNNNATVLLQIFIRGNPFRGTAGLNPKTTDFLKKFLKIGSLEALVIYGSPYLLNWLQEEIPDDLPLVFSYGQMPAAQAIACQVLFGLPESSHMGTANFL